MKKTTFMIVLAAVAAFYLPASWSVKASETNGRQAMDILQNMTRILAGAEQLSVTLRSSYDAPQENGQMVEFGAVRQIQIKRPDRLRVDLQESDGDQRIMVFDGKQIIVHNVTENIYAKAAKAGTVDDAREDRQQYGDDVREDRQDYIDDEWDDHYHHGGAAFVTGVAVGAAASSNYVTHVPCNTTVIVNNVTYYNCDSTWYSRGSQGGDVVYIITSAPAGY